MQPRSQANKPSRFQPARALAIAGLISAVLVGGCGGNSPSAATTATETAASSGGSGALAFANCMRASGVPNFPDPQPGGGDLFQIPAGANPAAPAYRAARAKCQELMPNGAGPESGPPPSQQTLLKLVRIARCMRAHGISGFPDPRTSAPATLPPGIAVLTNFDGAIMLFPQTLDMQAPAYRQALTACGAPPLGLAH
jgi:hypothetical protein